MLLSLLDFFSPWFRACCGLVSACSICPVVFTATSFLYLFVCGLFSLLPVFVFLPAAHEALWTLSSVIASLLIYRVWTTFQKWKSKLLKLFDDKFWNFYRTLEHFGDLTLKQDCFTKCISLTEIKMVSQREHGGIKFKNKLRTKLWQHDEKCELAK